MTAASERVAAAAAAIAGVAGASMNPQALVADLLDLAAEYGDGFEEAVEQVRKALADVVAGRLTASPLKYGLPDWPSYHFQSSVSQGHAADPRIAFRRDDEYEGDGGEREARKWAAELKRLKRLMYVNRHGNVVDIK